MGGDTLLNLILANEEGVFRDERVEGSLGCSDHEIVKLRVLVGRKTGRIRAKVCWVVSGTYLSEAHRIFSEREKKNKEKNKSPRRAD